jgi:cbb3-type cytochrome oxidase subunit 3
MYAYHTLFGLIIVLIILGLIFVAYNRGKKG